MGVFHVFKIAQMAPNGATRHIYIKEKERWLGFLQKICLLMHIQNETCSFKGL